MIKETMVGASVVLFVAACSTQSRPDLVARGRALTTSLDFQYLFVPAYFGSTENPGYDYSWNGIQEYNDPDPDTGSQTVFYAIANENSGPGTGVDPILQGNITRYLTNELIQVFGYVNFASSRSMTDVTTDITAWSHYSGLTGIFFDVASRTDSSNTNLGRAEYVAELVTSLFADQYGQNGSVFNWGSTNATMEPYVNCVGTPGQGAPRNTRTWFVTEETSQNTYTNVLPNDLVTPPLDSNYSWLTSYNPMHFINLIHGVTQDGSTVQSLMEKSRRLNAFNVYLTDRLDPCSCVTPTIPSGCPANDMDNSECGLTDPATGYSSRPWNPLAGFGVGGSPVWLDQNLDGNRGVFAYPGADDDLAPRSTCPAQVSN